MKARGQLTRVIHGAWDHGAIAAAMDAVLGFHLTPARTLTLCGKRVESSSVDNDAFNCPDCQSRAARHRAELRAIAEALDTTLDTGEQRQ